MQLHSWQLETCNDLSTGYTANGVRQISTTSTLTTSNINVRGIESVYRNYYSRMVRPSDALSNVPIADNNNLSSDAIDRKNHQFIQINLNRILSK